MGDAAAPGSGFRTYEWSNPALVAVAFLALAAGFGQFGAVAALGDVAKTFGHLKGGATFADEAGLSGTVLGLGLAIIRAASLIGLPLASLADRFGRKPMLALTCAAGLVLTVLTAVSPTYWWFVAIFALGRPFLSATTGLTQVEAVELTSSHERAKAVSLMAAGYALGAGLAAIVHSLAEKTLGFRGIFALAVVPLVFLPVLAHKIVEPDRFARVAASSTGAEPVLGPVARPYRRRLLIVALLAFSVSVITGPANSLVFIYAQNFLHLGGVVTSGMVVAAGAAGLGGLLLGRWLSDRLGRRPTVALAMTGMAIFGTIAYTGPSWALFVGYVAGVSCGGVFAPAGGSLANELFPTSVRASVAGWYIATGVAGAVVGLLAFGAVSDVRGTSHHLGLAAAVVFLPMMFAAGFLLLLPETKGREPEDLWLDAAQPTSAGEGVDAEPDPTEQEEEAQPRPVGEQIAQEGAGTSDPGAAEFPGTRGGQP
ncbi:MAG TPA: MFS transporter [Acidimicrobiales bacterium]|nr:MFS transporter [Acidimicrobiales bacterium]